MSYNTMSYSYMEFVHLKCEYHVIPLAINRYNFRNTLRRTRFFFFSQTSILGQKCPNSRQRSANPERRYRKLASAGTVISRNMIRT